MKLSWSSLTAMVILTIVIPTQTHATNTPSSFNTRVVKERLTRMESIVTIKYTQEVADYIRAYLTYGQRSTEFMMGYGKVYVPAIEYNLQLTNMPDDLKYLTVIESNMRPYATSTVGAAGLWQIMPQTARLYGLEMNDYVDERRDPFRSTEVALKYLANLYEQFGNWELALAAYNCGPYRLKQIIRRTGIRDFWKLRPSLPVETANYVPKFIAATYVMKYGFLHGITPRLKDANMLNTSAVAVFDEISFNEIQSLTGTNYRLIRNLNSMFYRGIVPASEHGFYVSLPKKASEILGHYVNNKCKNAPVASMTRVFTYTIKKGDSLSKIANKFHCTTQNLRQWNGVKGDRIFIGQKLIIKIELRNA